MMATAKAKAPAKTKAPPKPKAAPAPRKAAANPAPWETDAPVASQAPTSTDADVLLTEWIAAVRAVSDIAAPVIEVERELRKQVIARYFSNPQEGTNRLPVGTLGELVFYNPWNRTVDEAALPAVAAKLPEGSVPYLIRYKAALELERYRGMPPELRAIFDEALITKPGSPVLKLEPPKDE